MNAAQNVDYVLGPDDLIEIDVYQVDELKRTARVSASGFIKLPLAGKIEVTGHTIPALEKEISKRLESYLQEPVVSVFIKEYRSQRITVLGAVKSPQVYAVTGQKFLLDMLSMSEGLEEDAGDICYIQRGDETIVINFDELLVKGNARLNVPVFAGDVIHVPKGGIVFVSGAVTEPGSFVMQGSVTLTQAIAMAKGLKFEAMQSRMRIYRDTGSEIRDTIDVDYDKVLAQKSSDVILKDNDIVIVPKSGAKSFFKGFIETLGGFVSFGKAL
jgi:polysaccharide export outer membrane protein